jgi:hypothetical protein
MKTTTLPPLRVDPKLRKQIESVLQAGESLSEFMLGAIVAKTEHRREEEAFLKLGAARLTELERIGAGYTPEQVFGEVRQRIAKAKRRSRHHG